MSGCGFVNLICEGFFYILYFVDKVIGVLIGYKCILILLMIIVISVVIVN